ncbi:protein kinase domain-containing protein [Streptomyces sp. 8N616]|uniref:protein kinase domain-containing protein n=1 Tax=Streptomyces sp. 8N616 TaxID=3457414 RepID=UPI003FCF6701
MPPLRSAGTGPEAEDPEYAGQYRLEARLGSGGMGVVHLARSASGLRLAVKVVHADFAADDEFRARFRQEVAAARRVSGAFTAPVVDADPDAVRPWMATLFIPGPTLADHVKRNGPLASPEVRRLAAGLAEALRDIHRAGVVHRDLKPGNVLLAEDGPKVIDFGISRPSDSNLRTETGKLIGTPPFMAPEQFQRPRSVGPAADIFALGSVLVHAATGRGPFDSESPYIVAYQVVHDEADLADVAEDLVPMIRACLAKDPADRPTPDALMAMLRAMAEDGDAAGGGPGAADTAAGGTGSVGGPGPAAAARGHARVPAQRRYSPAGTGGVTADAVGHPAPMSPEWPEVHEQGSPFAAEAAWEPDNSTAAHQSLRATPDEAALPEIARGTGAHRDEPEEPEEPEGPAPRTTARSGGRATTATPKNASDLAPAAGGTDGPAVHKPILSGPGQATAMAARRRRRVRWVALGAAAAVLLGAGVAVAVRQTDGERPMAATTRSAATAPTSPSHPWRTTVAAAGAARSGRTAPVCSYAPYAGGSLYCTARGVKAARFDSATGREVWSRDAAAKASAEESAAEEAAPEPPVFCGGLLHVMSVSSGGGARLEALDPASGATRWSKDVSAYEGRVYHAGDTVLLVSGDGTVRALRGATGEERWRRPYAGRGLPVFTAYRKGGGGRDGDGNGKVQTAYGTATSDDGSHTFVTAIDPATGDTRWQRTLTGYLTPVGTAANGKSLLLTSSDLQQRTDAVVRYDPGSRRERRVPLAVPLDSVTTGVHGDTVHLLAHGGTLMAVDTLRSAPAADPERAELWRMETSVSNASQLAATADRLYFTAADGRLLAIDARRGVLAGQTPPRMNPENRGYAAAVPAPVVAGGRVFGAAPDGTVFAVDGSRPGHW